MKGRGFTNIMKSPKEAAESFKVFFNKALDGMLLIELKSKKIHAGNKKICRMLGYGCAELKKMNIVDILFKKDLSRILPEFNKLATDKISISRNITVRKKNGGLFYADVTTSIPIVVDGKRYMLGIFRDITERRNKEEELCYRSEIINQMEEGVAIIRVKDLKIVHTNPKFDRMFGYKRWEILNKNISILNAPAEKSWKNIARGIKKSLKEKGTWQGKVNNLKKDGIAFWCQASVSIYTHPRFGKVWISVYTDIDELKRTQLRVTHLNDILKTIRSVNRVISLIRDPEILLKTVCGVLVKARAYRLAWVGIIKKGDRRVYPVARAGVGIGYLDKIKVSRDTGDTGQGPTGMAIRHRRPVLCADIARNPDYSIWRKLALKYGFASSVAVPVIYGKRVFGSLTVLADRINAFDKEEVTLLTELAGDLGLALQSIEDANEQKRTEEELYNSREILRIVFDNIPQRVFWKDKNLAYLGANKPFALDAGFNDPEDVIGKNDFQLIWKIFANSYRAYDKKVIKSGKPKLNYERPLFKAGEEQAWSQTSKVPMRDKDGKIFGVLGTYEDITERKKAEDALRRSQAKFKNLAELLPQTVFEFDKNGKLTFINRNGLKIFGYSGKDLLKGINVGQLIAPADRERIAKMIGARIKKKNYGADEYQALRKNGAVFPVIIYSNYTEAEDKTGGLRGIVVDISDIREAEKVLRETAAKDEALLASIADGVIAVDDKGRIILINNVAADKLGWAKERALGKKWFEILRKEDEKGNIVPPEKSEFYYALNAGKISTAIESEHYIGKDGKKFPVAKAVAPVVIGGKIIGAINVFRDVSKEKALEQAKNDFLSLASHQLRTPLSAIKWTLEGLMQDSDLKERQKQYLRDVYSSNERLIGLVNGLLNVARIEAGKRIVNKQPTNLVDLIDYSYKTCKPNAEKRGQTIKLFIDAPLKKIRIDRTLFNETFNNLLSNAISYGSENSKITVRVKLEEKSYVISVNNFGPPITKSDRDKIFNKFFRGQNVESYAHVGTGLGLFLAKAAAEANGGKIWFESNAKDGTTFYFTVPL
jgi:PAS domain S-box-containing protein